MRKASTRAATGPGKLLRGGGSPPPTAGAELAASLFDYDSAGDGGQDSGLTFLSDRDEHEWEILLGHAERRRFSAGEVVVRRGDCERALYLLTTGTLQVLPEERGAVVSRILAPAVVGEIAFLDGGSRTLDVVAATPGEVHRLTLDGFEALAARYPELGRAILFDLGRIAATRLRRQLDLAARGA
jgi:CRP/FNR family cyclic AMP-dependent transcriptional regulator